MKERLTHNIGLKIVALVCAAVLWLVIINVDDPVKTVEFDNIEVQLVNTDTVTRNNKVCQILDKSNYISVKIIARRSVLDGLDESNIRAYADLNDIADSIQVSNASSSDIFRDTVKISLSTNKNNNDLEGISASAEYIKVGIEDLKKISKSIAVEVNGEPADGYMIGNVSTNSNLVRIQGPASEVKRVETAKIMADVTGFSDTITWEADVRLFDEDGKEIVSDTLTKSVDKVRTMVEILEKKDVMVSALVEGEPAAGYGLNGVVTVSPAKVTIAGKKTTLDTISKIVIPASALDVTGMKDSLETVVNLRNYLPSDVKFADEEFSGHVKVNVGIEAQISNVISVPLSQLTVANIPEGYSYKVIVPESDMIISVKGMREKLETVNKQDIIAKADFEQLTDEKIKITNGGEYELKVDFTIKDGVEVQEPYTITLQLVKD